MSLRKTRGALVGVLIGLQAGFPAVSEAGPILDWLFGRRHTTQYALYCPTTPCATTTACSPVTAAPCSPCGQVGTTAFSPVTLAAQPVVPTAQPAVVNYAPQTAFQTVQAQVPVTYYRPATVLDPTSGAQVSTVNGCTLVQVQTQRRPRVGLFGWLWGGNNQPASPQPINVQYPTTTVGFPPTTVLPTPATTFAAPTLPTPATGNCAGCATPAPAFPTVPSAPINPGGAVLGNPPAATYPAPSGASGGAMTVPADQPPSLNTPPQGNALQGNTPQGNTPQGNYQGSSYRPAPPMPIAPPQNVDPLQNSAPSQSIAPPQNSNVPQSGATQPPRDANGMQLIPYPERSEPATESSAPPLLHHRGRTASFRSSEPWSFSLISWPEPGDVRQASAAAPVQPAPVSWAPVEPANAEPANVDLAPTTPVEVAPLQPGSSHVAPPQAASASVSPLAAPTEVWDDSGWRPARPR